MKVVWKKWGYEVWIENNELYCLKELVCENKEWSSEGKWHYHKVKDETFFVLEGWLRLETESISIVLKERDKFRIRPGTCHRFRAETDRCRFIEASTHHSDEDSFRHPKWKNFRTNGRHRQISYHLNTYVNLPPHLHHKFSGWKKCSQLVRHAIS